MLLRWVAPAGAGLSPPGSGFGLGSALGLHMFSDKAASESRTLLDKSLRLIFERVGQRIAANIVMEGFSPALPV